MSDKPASTGNLEPKMPPLNSSSFVLKLKCDGILGRCRTRWRRCGKFHQPDSAHAEHRHTDTDMAVSDCAECVVGRTEADSSLPRHPFGEGPHLVRWLHVLLTEVSVVEVFQVQAGYTLPEFDDLADTGVAEPDGVVGLFGPEDVVLLVGASGTGVALVGGRLAPT